VYEAPTIVATCMNCISPGSLSATLALIVIGASIALTVERRKFARVRAVTERQKARKQMISAQ
jgi:hypothetical protein